MHYSITRRRTHRPALIAAALIAVALIYSLGVLAPAARADGPGSGTPTTVSLGDSFISGEAGRWAGNTDESSSKTDALGSTAYYDNATNSGELIKGCHRSKAAEVYIGSGVTGENLACSGAKTSSFTEGETFKPGIDFYNSGGKEGQALMLQHYAATHNVKLVALSIGGNNFNFASIVTTCVEDFLESTIFYDFYCSKESSVTNNFTSSNVNKIKGEIETSIRNVATAMTNAGYSSSQYTILVQNYPSPIPNGSEFRYTQSGYSRQFTGGCGFWNTDANYANATMLPTI
ncbi:MAG: SGNH/GDSL hydrolase family protein, partial [Solirubrobacteraceae bacterium]